MTVYVTLLRGINVGGKNLIRMPALKASTDRNAAVLTDRLETMLAGAFDDPASVVIRSLAQMRQVVGDAPEGFGADPRRFRSDVICLKPPLTASTAMRSVRTREGVDRAWATTTLLDLMSEEITEVPG